jgi:hypothetical protein
LRSRTRRSGLAQDVEELFRVAGELRLDIQLFGGLQDLALEQQVFDGGEHPAGHVVLHFGGYTGHILSFSAAVS